MINHIDVDVSRGVSVRRVVHIAAPPALSKKGASPTDVSRMMSQVDVQKVMARDGCLSQYEKDKKVVRDPQVYLRWTPIYPHPLPTSYKVSDQVVVHVVLGSLSKFS